MRLLSLLFIVVCLVLAGLARAQSDPLAEIRSLTAAQAFEQALQELDQFLSTRPDHVEARLYRGVILTRQGKVAEAIDAFTELSVKFPNLPEPHNNLAVLYASQNRYEQARLALLRAIELQPKYDTAHENLGDIYTKLASIAYDRAYSLNNNNVRAREKAIALSESMENIDPNLATPQPTTETPIAAVAGAASLEPTLSEAPLQTSEETSACYVAGQFDNASDQQRVADWFTRSGAAAQGRVEEGHHRIGYRVFLAPVQSKVAANAQVLAMKDQGLRDIIRIDGGELANAISLGVYKTQEAAARRMQQITKLGYKPKSAPRLQIVKVWYLDINMAGSAATEEGFQTAFPQHALIPSRCLN